MFAHAMVSRSVRELVISKGRRASRPAPLPGNPICQMQQLQLKARGGAGATGEWHKAFRRAQALMLSELSPGRTQDDFPAPESICLQR